MNFKKILSMIGMFSVVVPMATTVIACDPQTSNDDVINEDRIQKQLEDGFPANDLSIANTQNDALNFLQNLKEIKGIATLSLTNSMQGKDHLKAEKNTLYINLQVGAVTHKNIRTIITNVNPLNPQDQKIVNPINSTTYLLKDINPGAKAADQFKKITDDFIKKALPEDVQKDFNSSKFKFTDIQIGGKSLTDADLINREDRLIVANIVYTYANVKESTRLRILLNHYSYQQIQNELIIKLTAKPIDVTIQTFDKSADGETAVQSFLQSDPTKYFKNYLSGEYKKEFNSKYLGLYNHVYKSKEVGPANYVSGDFFTHPGTYDVYFFIAYNEKASTAGGKKDNLIPLTLNIKEI